MFNTSVQLIFNDLETLQKFKGVDTADYAIKFPAVMLMQDGKLKEDILKEEDIPFLKNVVEAEPFEVKAW